MKKYLLIATVFVLSINPVLANRFIEQERGGIRFAINEVKEPKYVIEQPEQITAGAMKNFGYYAYQVTVTNNSDKVLTLSPKSFGQLPLIEAQRVGKPLKTTKGIFALIGGLIGPFVAVPTLATGFSEYIESKGYHSRGLSRHQIFFRVAAVSTVFSIFCWDYFIRKASKPFQEAFAKKMINDEITIQPGEKLEKLIFLDLNGYNTKEFDVCLYNADDKSDVTAFHVDWH